MIRTVLIAGAGAVGLTVADAFYRYDPGCVSALAGNERRERYRSGGFWVNGSRLDIALTDSDSCERIPDLVIVACKGHHLDAVIESLRGVFASAKAPARPLVVSLLNGISSEERLGEAFGGERIPLAMILGTDAQREAGGASGVRVRFTRRGVVHFGGAEGKETERDREIAGFFARAGLPFEYHPNDMKRTLWYKFMINVGVNQTSALLRLPYRAFKQTPAGIPEVRKIAESAMEEVIAVAAAEGIILGSADIENWYGTLAGLEDGGYTSMAQDALAGRRTEAELFGKTVMEYGGKHGIPTPVNEVLYLALRALERPDTGKS